MAEQLVWLNARLDEQSELENLFPSKNAFRQMQKRINAWANHDDGNTRFSEKTSNVAKKHPQVLSN